MINFDEKRALDALNTVFEGNFVSAFLSEGFLTAKNLSGEDFKISIDEAKVQGLI